MHTPHATTATVHFPPETIAPVRPPKPEQDALDGYLNAYLAQSVKPHRDRLVDILRVIDGTKTGRELLDYFRDPAILKKVPTVNLLAPDAKVPDSAAAHDVWLNEEALTGIARETGVSAETRYAPSVFQSLSITCAAVLARNHIDSIHKDLAAMQLRFRAELDAGGDTLSARADRAATIDALRLDAQRTRAINKLSPGGDSPTAPADPKPDGETSDNSSPARRATLTPGTQANTALGVPETDAKRGDSRPLSAPSSLSELAEAVAAPVLPNSTPSVVADSAKKEEEAANAPKRTKSMRRRLTWLVSRPFRAIEGLLARRHRILAQSGKPGGVPTTDVYKAEGTISRKSSTVSMTSHPDVKPADRVSLGDAHAAKRGSRVEATTASTTNLAEAHGTGTPSLAETQAVATAGLVQASTATTTVTAQV